MNKIFFFLSCFIIHRLNYLNIQYFNLENWKKSISHVGDNETLNLNYFDVIIYLVHVYSPNDVQIEGHNAMFIA